MTVTKIKKLITCCWFSIIGGIDFITIMTQSKVQKHQELVVAYRCKWEPKFIGVTIGHKSSNIRLKDNPNNDHIIYITPTENDEGRKGIITSDGMSLPEAHNRIGVVGGQISPHSCAGNLKRIVAFKREIVKAEQSIFENKICLFGIHKRVHS